MSRTDPARKSARASEKRKQRATEPLTVQQKRETLITPLTDRLRALWSKKTLGLTSDEIQLLQLMSTLVRLSDLDVLQTLSVAHQIMPPSEWET